MERQGSAIFSFRTLVEPPHVGVLGTDESGSVRFCSARAAALFGYPERDVIGMKIADLIVSDDSIDGPHAGDGQFRAIGQRLGGSTFDLELTVVSVNAGAKKSLAWIVRRHRDDAGALEDSVTHLPTRRFCVERLRELYERIGLGHGAFALMVVALDGFDDVERRFGRAAGDAILIESAGRLRAAAGAADFIGRVGNSEFCAAFPIEKSPSDLEVVARSVVESLGLPIELAGDAASVAPRIGVAIAPGDAENADDLLARAQSALDRARSEGASTHFHNAELSERFQRRNDMQSAIRAALDQNRFTLDFLPLIDLASGEVSGAEALLRWHDPERGTIPPLEFIPFAEESGLMVPIGAWVLREALRNVTLWNAFGRDLRVAVNLSARQLHAPAFVRQLSSALNSLACRPAWLELELTEAVAMHHVATVQMLLSEVRRLGVRIALDDFGAGYSSMAYLKSLPVDIIKIDRSFVSGVPHNNDDSSIVRAIVAFALCTGRDVRAEGVTTIEQARWLHAEGCDSAQGFFFSKPIPAPQFEEWLSQYEAEGVDSQT